MNEISEAITIEPFRGDVDELHRVAVESWRDEYGVDSFPDLYDPPFLDWLREGVPADHVVAAYDGDELVAFVCNVPRTLQVGGRRCRAVLSALLICRKAYLRRGIAEGMIRSALELNERYGYDLAVFYLEANHRSSRLFAKLADQGHRIVPLKTLVPWLRIFDLGRVRETENLARYQATALRVIAASHRPGTSAPQGKLRPFELADLEGCLALAETEASRADISRRFDADELSRFLDGDGVTKTLVLERDGAPAAFVTWMPHIHLGRSEPHASWAWIANVAYGSLDAPDRRRLWTAVCREWLDDGMLGVVAWPMGGPVAPLVTNHFVPYPRRVGLHAWLFDASLDPGKVRRVFEVQI